MSEDLKKQYHCKNCKSIILVSKETPLERLKCCGKPELELWGQEYDENESKLKLGEAYEDILEVLDYYMDMSDEQKQVIALWIIGTYLHEAFPTFPFLFINAMRGSGKTRLLKIISNLAHRSSGMVSTEPSEAVLYRTPKGNTLVFDEFENIGGKDKNTFRQYLNASYKAGGVVQRARRVRTKEGSESYEIETFEPYKPIAMANIWGMEEVVEDRCITVILQKSNNPLKTKKMEDFDTNDTMKRIKRNLHTEKCSFCDVVMSQEIYPNWNTYINTKYIYNIYNINNTNNNTTPEEKKPWKDHLEDMFLAIDNSGIDGRNLELIFPLLITSRLLNEDIFKQTLVVLKDMIASKKEEELAESKDVTLIDFIATQYEPSLDYVSVTEITKHFKAYLNEGDAIEDAWLNSKWLGRALKRLDLVLDKRRLARGNEVTLNVLKAREKLKMFRK